MPRQNIFLVMLTFGSLLPGSLSGCGHKEDATAGPKFPVVRVSSPIERAVTDYEYFTGRTDAVSYVETRARVSGYLEKINFKAGTEVKKGQVLFQVDPRPYKAQLDQAESQVLLSEANLKLAVANLARGRQIGRTPGAIALEDLDKLAAETASADATVKSAKAKTELAALNLKFTDVLSPIDGIVGRNLLTVGNLVIQDSTLLTTIVSVDPMYVYFDVDERTLLRVQQMVREGKVKTLKEAEKNKMKIPMQFGLANEDESYPHEGELDFVNNQVDTSTGTIQVRGLLANPQQGDTDARLLTSGLFVRVRVPLGSAHQALLVPQSALGTDQAKKFLYVVNDQKIVEYRPVTLGAAQADGLQVVDPVKIVRTKEGVRLARDGEPGENSLRPTDQIIVAGLQRVRSGMTVEPKAAADDRK
jgi:multidrug efflux system membrane fusion protein